jgi:uncharacterized protein (TIGR03083 family)
MREDSRGQEPGMAPSLRRYLRTEQNSCRYGGQPEWLWQTPRMRGPEVDALALQLRDLSAQVERLSEVDFASPTRCPGWAVAELVAHCEGMLVRLVGENAEPVIGQAEIDRVGYYRYDPDGPREGEDPQKTFSEVIRGRVIDELAGRTGLELRADLVQATATALRGITAVPADRVIKRSGHPRMTFGEFVASRNLEFGVHTMDIAAAVGRSEEANPAAAAIIVGILDGLLGEPLPSELGWDATTYILIGTGRRNLTAMDGQTLGLLAERFPLLQ